MAKETKKDMKSKITIKKKEDKKTTIIQEENDYKRTILAAILIVIIFIGGYIGIALQKDKKETTPTKDEISFKEEYESLNGTTRSNGITNKTISIIEHNGIEYISLKEAEEIIEKGSGVIYFGYAACPLSRISVPILLNAFSSSDLDKIYYVNVRPDDKTENDIRDIYALDDKNKYKQIQDAKEEYYKILDLLKNELKDYKLITSSGKEVNTKEKRLNTPTVLAVKDGKLVGFHEGTVKKHKEDEDGKVRDLTKDEEKELLNTYSKIISSYLK